MSLTVAHKTHYAVSPLGGSFGAVIRTASHNLSLTRLCTVTVSNAKLENVNFFFNTTRSHRRLKCHAKNCTCLQILK